MTVLPGVTIGDGAVVGAGAVVTEGALLPGKEWLQLGIWCAQRESSQMRMSMLDSVLFDSPEVWYQFAKRTRRWAPSCIRRRSGGMQLSTGGGRNSGVRHDCGMPEPFRRRRRIS